MTTAFITGNEQKFKEAFATCAAYGVELQQLRAKTHEMQSEDIEEVAIDKAKQAFAQLGRPLVVNDAGWRIPALGGFPGAFMRYINEWFSAEDFVRLMEGKEDRRIFLIEVVAYHDGKEIKTFTMETEGAVIGQPKGVSGAPSDKVVCLGKGETRTIAERLDASLGVRAFSGQNVWDLFGDFLARSKAHLR